MTSDEVCKCGHEEWEHPNERCERTGEGITDGECVIEGCDCEEFRNLNEGGNK